MPCNFDLGHRLYYSEVFGVRRIGILGANSGSRENGERGQEFMMMTNKVSIFLYFVLRPVNCKYYYRKSWEYIDFGEHTDRGPPQVAAEAAVRVSVRTQAVSV